MSKKNGCNKYIKEEDRTCGDWYNFKPYASDQENFIDKVNFKIGGRFLCKKCIKKFELDKEVAQKMNNKRIVKYLKGLSGVFNQLSKEVNKNGINEDSLNLMKKIGSDLLFKGVSLNIKEKFTVSLTSEGDKE